MAEGCAECGQAELATAASLSSLLVAGGKSQGQARRNRQGSPGQQEKTKTKTTTTTTMKTSCRSRDLMYGNACCQYTGATAPWRTGTRRNDDRSRGARDSGQRIRVAMVMMMTMTMMIVRERRNLILMYTHLCIRLIRLEMSPHMCLAPS